MLENEKQIFVQFCFPMRSTN